MLLLLINNFIHINVLVEVIHISSGKLIKLLNMAIYSWFTYKKMVNFHDSVSLP